MLIMIVSLIFAGIFLKKTKSRSSIALATEKRDAHLIQRLGLRKNYGYDTSLGVVFPCATFGVGVSFFVLCGCLVGGGVIERVYRQPPKTLLRRFAANFVAIRSQKT